MFYPGNASELRTTIQKFLDQVQFQPGSAPKALIVPHAGYSYSGSVAATAYARLRPYRDRYTRVILLGPCHRVAIRYMALSSVAVFRTPLGDVPLEKELIAALNMPAFTLVPLVIGDVAPETVAKVINILWGGEETLIVVSSDLSHYLSYDEARARDRFTCEAIERLDAHCIDHANACGSTPIRGLLIEAKRRAMEVTTLGLRNSGDTAGGKDQVVGYGAWVFSEIDPDLSRRGLGKIGPGNIALLG